MDVTGAATHFPDLNFLVYHSGFKGLEDALPAAEDGFGKTSYVPWVSDICSWKKKNPRVSNIYMEMGSAFAKECNLIAETLKRTRNKRPC